MTGFSREDVESDWGLISWEIRSVNHRYLDMNFRLPEACRNLEQSFKAVISSRLTRGKVDVTLQIKLDTKNLATINVDKVSLEHLMDAVKTIESQFHRPGTLNGLDVLRWPGIVQESRIDSREIAPLLTTSLENAVNNIVEHRTREGAVLKQLIEARCELIEGKVRQVIKYTPELLNAKREKLMLRLAEIQNSVDQSRLEQEMVFFTQKMDVEEELDRMLVHTAEIKRVLITDDAKGRRLDFLAQELSREANTLASKINDTKITHAAVDIKVLIEQIREQVQNVE